MGKIKWKKYDYTVQWGPGNSIAYRPLIEVHIASPKNSKGLNVLALIDSGTDGTVFNADVARSLDIDPGACQKIKMGGIGVMEGFICDIKLTIPDFKISMEIPVAFLEKPPFDALLGQRFFFEQFSVMFEKSKNRFQIALAD